MQDMVELKSLKDVFDFQYRTGSNTSFVLINRVQYSDGVVFRNGAYFVPLKKFLRFFLATFRETGTGTLTINDPGILTNRNIADSNLLIITKKFNPFPASVVIAGYGVFIDSSSFSKMTGKTFTLNRTTGIALFGGRRVDRWIEKDGRVYSFREDLESAYGDTLKLAKPIPVKDTEETDEQREKAAEIRERVWATFNDQVQYGSGNPDYPIGYRISLTVRNRYHYPIKIRPSGMIMTDQNGNSYQGQILGSSGLSSTGSIIDTERIISPAAVPLNYFNIQPRDSGNIIVDFLLPKDANPAFFIFQYDGITLLQQSIMKSFIP